MNDTSRERLRKAQAAYAYAVAERQSAARDAIAAGDTIGEVAAAMGVQPGTVRSIVLSRGNRTRTRITED